MCEKLKTFAEFAEVIESGKTIEQMYPEKNWKQVNPDGVSYTIFKSCIFRAKPEPKMLKLWEYKEKGGHDDSVWRENGYKDNAFNIGMKWFIATGKTIEVLDE